MNLEILKVKLRADYSNNIIPLVKQDKCELCGNGENLEVHHNEMFANQLFKVLNLLGYDEMSEFNENQVEIIRLMMLGSQIKTDNVTLCDECHKRIHRENGGNNNTIKYNLDKILNDNKAKSEKLEYINNVLVPYLDSIVGNVMLQVKDRKELIEKIDVKSNGKLLKKINNLNGALEENELPYRIVEFVTSKVIEGKQKRYPNAWKIEKLMSY